MFTRGPDRLRIIPARAGFTWRCRRRAAARPDHPRSRGVYVSSRTSTSGGIGSSPLARGLLPTPTDASRMIRIIPARAGFTPVGASSLTPTYGSSPLARGLPEDAAGGGLGFGIIPARAGFTSDARARQNLRKDHPRSRGVYRNKRLLVFLGRGSSPLARGLLISITMVPESARIIPARAGFTDIDSFMARTLGDHPRSRGVYMSRYSPASSSKGSSPLARGLLDLGHRVVQRERIIPARAGFTR